MARFAWGLLCEGWMMGIIASDVGHFGLFEGVAEGTIREKLCRWCLRRLGGVPKVGGYDWDLR